MEEITNPNPKNVKKKHLIRNLLIGALFAALGLLIVISSLMSNPNKPGGSYMYIGTVKAMNRMQQGYYLEHQKFASSLSSLEELGFRVDPEAKNYIFFTVNFRQAVFNYGLPAEAYNYELNPERWRRVYVGGVFITKLPGTNELTTTSIICEADVPGIRANEPPVNAQTCGSNTSKMPD